MGGRRGRRAATRASQPYREGPAEVVGLLGVVVLRDLRALSHGCAAIKMAGMPHGRGRASSGSRPRAARH